MFKLSLFLKCYLQRTQHKHFRLIKTVKVYTKVIKTLS